MHGVYGTIPADLAQIPSDAVQFSPLMPGAANLELQAPASLDSMTMLAPRGNIEREYTIALGLRALQPGATLIVVAPKDQGGTRLRKNLATLGCLSDQTHRRHHRICTCRRPDMLTGLNEAIAAGSPRLIATLGVWSQPGVFSWDRLDPGSALLLQYLPQLRGRGADFGCGTGVLTRSLLQTGNVQHITLIDIDRRAIDAARRNICDGRVAFLWADVRTADEVPKPLDFVAMNPPFHDQGGEDQDLGRAFICRAADVLRPGGVCLLTANRHLPYEAIMQSRYASVRLLVQTEGFKIYEAQK